MIFPVIVPQVTRFECSEVHYVLGVGEIPPSTSAFDALRGRFALSLGRATADLDSARTKFAIVNDFTTLRNLSYQLFQGLKTST